MDFIQADTTGGCWTLPTHSGKRKPLWAMPPKRRAKGPGTAFFSLEDATKGKRDGLRGIVVDHEGRVYGSRKCDVLKTGVKKITLSGTRLEVEVDYRVFHRPDGTLAMVEVLELLNVPEEFRQEVKMEPVQLAAPVLPIAAPVAQPAVVMPLTMPPPPNMVFAGHPSH